MDNKPKAVLALDQSTTATGWCIFINGVLKDFGVYTPSGNREERIYKTCQWTIDKIDQLSNYNIQVVIEDIQMQGNVETYKSLAQLQGSIITLLFHLVKESKVTKYEVYYASEWKATCGIKGRRRKEQKKSAQEFVFKKHNIEAPEDACDAICLGEHHLQKVDSVLNFE